MVRTMVPPFVDESQPKPAVVVLCGYQEHGKTTAALRLVDAYGFRRVSFADPIRAMLIAQGCPAWCFEPQHKNTPRPELCGMTPRAAMESLGDWGRDRAPDVWIRAWDRTLPHAPLVVIDDARYDLEAAAALGVARRRSADFVMIEVVRPSFPHGTSHGSNRIPVGPAGVDVAYVVNDKSPDRLGRAVVDVLELRGLL